MAADPIKLQAQLHKLQSQLDEVLREKDAMGKGVLSPRQMLKPQMLTDVLERMMDRPDVSRVQT